MGLERRVAAARQLLHDGRRSSCSRALPLIHAIWPPSVCVGPQCVLAPIITTAGEVLPGFVQPWIRAFAISPGFSLVLAHRHLLAVGAQRRPEAPHQRRHARAVGRHARTAQAARRRRPTPAKTRTARRAESIGLRSNVAYQKFFQWLKWRFLPGMFGFTVLVGGFVAGGDHHPDRRATRRDRVVRTAEQVLPAHSAPVEIVETSARWRSRSRRMTNAGRPA